jgi:hypothetical protein
MECKVLNVIKQKTLRLARFTTPTRERISGETPGSLFTTRATVLMEVWAPAFIVESDIIC